MGEEEIGGIINETNTTALENMHKLLLEALRSREQEIFRYLAILGPALGGFIWLLYSDEGDGTIFTVGTVGVLFLLLLGAIYSLTLGYNYRYIVLELAKIEAVLNIRDIMLVGWPKSKQEFLDRYNLFGIPWCTPPEVIRVFWMAFIGGIIWVIVTSYTYNLITSLQSWVNIAGGVSLITGLLSPIWFGYRLKKLCSKEPESWEGLV